MATIKVHLLNFYGPYSHIEIVLENTSSKDKEFYRINRWETDPPNHSWDSDYELNSCKKYIQEASCVSASILKQILIKSLENGKIIGIKLSKQQVFLVITVLWQLNGF